MPCSLDLAVLREGLLECRPQLVFNLVESLGGTDSLSYLAAAVLDALGLPYTGNSTEALFTTNHKLMAKRLMQLAGLPTPHWLAADGFGPHGNVAPLEPPCIIKSVWEHGSRGLDDGNVVLQGNAALVQDLLGEFTARTGRPHFAESFIDGREFNLPMLDGPQGPQLLPLGEMDFSTFPADKPRIIGHRAKWHESSFEYNNTPRSFHFHEHDRPLVEHLHRLALECWRLFGLRGYVRSISAWTGPVALGSWRSTPTPAFRPMLVTPPPWKKPAWTTTTPSVASCRRPSPAGSRRQTGRIPVLAGTAG